MADIEEVIFTRLTTHAGLTALIGKRAYPLVMPQAEGTETKLPCIVYQKITGRHVYSHDGESNLAHPRYQFGCYAATYAGAKALVTQLRGALSAWSDMTTAPRVHASFCEMEIDFYDSTLNCFRVVVDYTIWHEEA